MVATALTSGCGAGRSDGSSTTVTGKVTTVTPRLCVGAPAASGACFNAADADVVSGAAIAVGDCVSVTYDPASHAVPAHASAVATATTC